MYSMVVEFRVKPDRIDDFLNFTRLVRQYDQKQGYKLPVTYRPLDVRTGKFMVEVRYDSRGELQEEQQKQSSDEMWQSLIAKAEATFVPGSQRIDILHREV
ncbi:MAG: hypothetical protein ACYDAG_10010 [Chloroflexota bacterium]